ncbi:MAG: ComF family protein [Dehalococcoidia bacterium]|nr:ComF family protein [Dehalococcoidia bacterium]
MWQEPLQIDGIRSVYYHEGAVKDAILQLKFHGLKFMGPFLAGHMSSYMTEHDIDADMIVPVPSYFRRVRERGYNQA